MDAEARVLPGERIEVLLEEDILLSDVGKDEINLSLVAGGTALDDGLHNLEHGRNASTARNHAEVAHHVGRVDEGTLGTPDPDGLPNVHARQVLGDIAGRVRLHEKIEVAGLVVTGDGGVGAHNLLARAIGLLNGRTNGNVLADRQAEDRGGGRELEPVTTKEVC